MRTLARLSFIFTAFYCCILQAGTPKIAVDGKSSIDFGDFPANIRQRGTFKIVNKGDALLKIINIRKTCGCSYVIMDVSEIKPRASSIITTEILPDSISGPFSKNFYVESNDPKQRFLQLNFTGRAIPLLTVYPPNFLYMGTLTAGKEYEYKFRIDTERDGVKLETGPSKTKFKTDIKLSQNSTRQFTLIVKVFPQQQNKSLNIEFELKVLDPSGWKPLQIKLQGRTGN